MSSNRALALEWAVMLEQGAAHPDTGASCTWSAPFERVRILRGQDGSGRPASLEVWWRRWQDGDIDAVAADELERRVRAFYAAWRSAERDYQAARRRSPAFALGPRPAAARARGRMDPRRKAEQRHRYKGAMADALEAFGRLHLRRDPRAGILRPRWLDHRPECRAGRGEGVRCSGCARIPLPPAPRWRRSAARRRKRDSLTIAEWLIDRAAAARSCQDVIALRDQACGGIMVLPQSCHVRAEPDCESARQSRVVRTYAAAVEQLDADRSRFLTLTIRNRRRDELAGGILELQAAAEKLRRRALWKGGRCRPGPCRVCGERRRDHPSSSCATYAPRCRQPADPRRPGWQLPHEPITAAMTTLEVTYNPRARTWHPHLHALIESPWIDQAELSEAWAELTDAPVVWIESVRRHADEKHAGNVERSLRELLKYAAKPHPAYVNAEDPAVAAELLVALRGRHLMATSGSLYGQELEDPDLERDTVLVWPDGEAAERPYHAPRICPLHNGEAAWRVLVGTRRRAECTAVPDPTRKGRRIYTWRPPAAPAGDTLPGDAPQELTDGQTITGAAGRE